MNCAMCNISIDKDSQSMRIIPEERMSQRCREFSNGVISLCRECRSNVIVNTTSLCNLVSRNDPNDIIEFIREVLRNGWQLSTPPSYADLVGVIDKAGFLTHSGKRWTYHNLRQMLVSRRFDKDAEFERLYNPKNKNMIVGDSLKIAESNGFSGGLRVRTDGYESRDEELEIELIGE